MYNPNGLSVNVNPAAIMGANTPNTGLVPPVDASKIIPQDQPPVRLNPMQKQNWNRFVQYVADNKMAGNPELDRRDKSVGLGLLQKFNATYPDYKIDPAAIPQIQQEFHNVRDETVQHYKANPSSFENVKSEADIMPGISPVDGWPGSKTLSHRFPVALLNKTDATGKTTSYNYGTDLNAYDKAIGNR